VTSVPGPKSSLIYQWPRRKQTIIILGLDIAVVYEISPKALGWSVSVL